jgi:hypothetical protein
VLYQYSFDEKLRTMNNKLGVIATYIRVQIGSPSCPIGSRSGIVSSPADGPLSRVDVAETLAYPLSVLICISPSSILYIAF